VGSKGLLRVVNSPKLDPLLKALIAPAALAAANERLGLVCS
jgi:hypothetical protein